MSIPTGENDENGVMKIYPDEPEGAYFVMGKVNAEWFDPKAGGSGDVKVDPISDTEVEIDCTGELPSRPKVYVDGFVYDGPDVTVKKRNEKGCVSTMRDFMNVEFGGYAELVKGIASGGDHGGDEISLVAATSHDGGKKASACYHFNLALKESGVRFKKEDRHVKYVKDKFDTSIVKKGLMEMKKIGIKGVQYNIDKKDNFVSKADFKNAVGKKLEIWVDLKLDNNWIKAHEAKDIFDKPFEDSSVPPLIGGANESIFKINNMILRISKLSSREINVP